MDWLGDDINVIGFEKAGIFRSGKPAICGQPKPPSTVPAHADDIGAEFYQVGIQFDYKLVGDGKWRWNSGSFVVEDLPIPNLPLQNAATALMALGASELEISDVDVVDGLSKATLPGRMQLINDAPTILLDVAHNPHSAKYLGEELQKRYPDKTIHAVVAMLEDKDISATLSELSHVVDKWYPASLQGPRAATAQDLCQHLSGNVQQYDDPVAAFESALTQVTSDEVIIVVGSFFTVGMVLEHWESKGK